MAETALVTGGGRGIGRAIAVRLAAEGHAVGVTARTEVELETTAEMIRDAGGVVAVAPGDGTDAAAVREIHEAITGELGPLSLLVNCAAAAIPPQPFTDTDPEAWWRVVETNVRMPMLFSHVALPSLLDQRRGHIINVNSLQGSKVQNGPMSYGVSKAALMRFTDALATEIAGSGVVAIDLSPGLVRTAMTANRPDLDRLPPTVWQSADDTANMVVTLVSGRYDGLHGRFVRVTDDLDDLLRQVSQDEDLRILRLRR